MTISFLLPLPTDAWPGGQSTTANLEFADSKFDIKRRFDTVPHPSPSFNCDDPDQAIRAHSHTWLYPGQSFPKPV